MKRILLSLIGLALLAVQQPAQAAQAASLYFAGAQSSYVMGQHITIDVMVNPNGALYDTVKIEAAFPAEMLQVQRVAINPVFSVASPDNFFNNSAGVISYGGGVPAGTTSLLKFATITFSIKKPGAATVVLSGANSLVLDDGENVFMGTGSIATFDITALPTETTPAPAKSIVVPKKTTPPVAANEIPSEQTTPAPENQVVAVSVPETAAAAAVSIPVVEPKGDDSILYALGNWWWLLAIGILLAIIFAFWKNRKNKETSQNPWNTQLP